MGMGIRLRPKVGEDPGLGARTTIESEMKR